MLDYTELSQNGEDLEQMLRELLLALEYKVRWSGRGADAGRDLIVEEPGDTLLGGKVRRWVVSCKHTAHAKSGAGRSVNSEDVGTGGGIVDSVHQHEADGYLLVCSTQPSSALVTRLESIEQTRGIKTHIWDGVELERMLTSPRGWPVAQRFMPRSANAAGWQVFATGHPNQFVGVTRGYYIRLTNRHGSRLAYQLQSMDARLDALAAIALPEGQEIRPRAMFCDDKHGTFTWYFDYLYNSPRHSERDKPLSLRFNARQLAEELGDGRVTYADGQLDTFEITMRPVDRGHDAYDADHARYYAELPAWI